MTCCHFSGSLVPRLLIFHQIYWFSGWPRDLVIFHCVFLCFQPFFSINNWLRESFIATTLPVGHFRSLQDHCSRKDWLNAVLVGLKYSDSGVVSSPWKKPDDFLYEIFQASAWHILTHLHMIQTFLCEKANNQIISSKTANFGKIILTLMIFF